MNRWIAVVLCPLLWLAVAGHGEGFVVVPAVRETVVVGLTNTLAQFETGTDFFPGSRGTYNGLIAPAGEIVPERSGYFQIAVTSYGRFSGRFTVGDDTVPLRGYFNSRGQAGVSIYKRVWDDCFCFRYLVLEWTVELDLIADSDEIEGRVVYERRGAWETEMYGLRAGYAGAGASAPQAGRYTMRLPGSVDAAVAPPGDGFGAVTVNSRGLVRMTGALADGVKISDSAYLSVDGYWPLYMPLNNGEGLLFGWVRIDGGAISGDLTWIKAQRLDRRYYPAGFEGTVNVAGGSFVPFAADVDNPLGWTAGLLTASDGNLASPLSNSVTLNGTGRVTNLGGELSGLTARVNRRTGVMKGSFIHPLTGRKTSCSGAVFQFENGAGGFFLGIDEGGWIRMGETP